jgi:hypothetical protein
MGYSNKHTCTPDRAYYNNMSSYKKVSAKIQMTVCEDKCVRERRCTPNACANVVRYGTCNTNHYRPMCQK